MYFFAFIKTGFHVPLTWLLAVSPSSCSASPLAQMLSSIFLLSPSILIWLSACPRLCLRDLLWSRSSLSSVLLQSLFFHLFLPAIALAVLLLIDRWGCGSAAPLAVLFPSTAAGFLKFQENILWFVLSECMAGWTVGCWEMSLITRSVTGQPRPSTTLLLPFTSVRLLTPWRYRPVRGVAECSSSWWAAAPSYSITSYNLQHLQKNKQNNLPGNTNNATSILTSCVSTVLLIIIITCLQELNENAVSSTVGNQC